MFEKEYSFKTREETFDKFTRLLHIKNKAIRLGYNIESTIVMNLDKCNINVSVKRKTNDN